MMSLGKLAAVGFAFAALSPLFAADKYKEDWSDLNRYPQAKWLGELKFGMYWHWNFNSIAGCDGWYGRNMYDPKSKVYKYHVEHYGDPNKFGYKDFEPLFTAKKFSAKQWVEDAYNIGARFIVGMAVHHDGYDMYDSSYTDWNSVKKNPHIDVIGSLEKEARARGMKFGATSHLAWNWTYFSTFMYPDKFDAKSAPELYNIHEPNTGPSKEFVQEWYNRTTELITKYQLDFLWFDFGTTHENYNKEYTKKLTAFYYNKSLDWNKEVALATKVGFENRDSQVFDVEQGKFGYIRYPQWMSDCTLNRGWFFLGDEYENGNIALTGEYWTLQLIDIVSKNGTLLLNLGPKADGSWPERLRSELLKIGAWLKNNGEAIYYTTPWIRYGEGPTHQGDTSHYALGETLLGKDDVRFTRKGNTLYAIVCGWRDTPINIRSLGLDEIPNLKIESISMLNSDEKISWEQGKDALSISFPKVKPHDIAYVFKIDGKNMFPEAKREVYAVEFQTGAKGKNSINPTIFEITLNGKKKQLSASEFVIFSGDGNSKVKRERKFEMSSKASDSADVSVLSDGNQGSNPRYSGIVKTKVEDNPTLKADCSSSWKIERIILFTTKDGFEDLLKNGSIKAYDKKGKFLIEGKFKEFTGRRW